MDPQDEKLVSGLFNDITTCVQSTNSQAAFLSCIEKDGFTAGCADCVSTYVGCIMNDCPSCQQGDTSTCQTCYTAKCTPALDTCAGFPSQPEAVQLTTSSGQCMTSQDEKLVSGLSNDITTCVQSTNSQ